MTTPVSLEELVLGYIRQQQGMVEPPSYEAYEVLLPDDLAARWQVPAFQRLAFTPVVANALHLNFGHRLVEDLIDDLRTRPANTRLFINNVRPEKPGLFALIEKSIRLPNAKVFAVPGAAVTPTLHHYVCFNFKASLIADEQRELLLPIWMTAQGGYAIRPAAIEAQAILEEHCAFPLLPAATAQWHSSAAPLSAATLAALVDRARQAAGAELGDTLQSLQKRLERYLELDRARLNDYYESLRRDVQRRLERAEPDRQPALESKLAAIQREHQSKLSDVNDKYQLRIQLELVNVAVIGQPKLDLVVEIRKRGVVTQRRATWDPLLHQVEPWTCDVCGLPGDTLQLCEHGHLAHSKCLAPQCVDCKRTFCQRCAADVLVCAVCQSPVCRHSLLRCGQCGQVTCQAHPGQCHTAREEQRPPEPAAAPVESARPPQAHSRTRQAPFRSATPSAAARAALDIYSDPEGGVITGKVRSKTQVLAVRTWALTDQGLEVNCQCSQPYCEADGMAFRPAPADVLPEQLQRMLNALAGEYAVTADKIRYFHIRDGHPHPETKLKIPARWKETAVLERAAAGFELLRQRNDPRRL